MYQFNPQDLTLKWVSIQKEKIKIEAKIKRTIIKPLIELNEVIKLNKIFEDFEKSIKEMEYWLMRNKIKIGKLSTREAERANEKQKTNDAVREVNLN